MCEYSEFVTISKVSHKTRMCIECALGTTVIPNHIIVIQKYQIQTHVTSQGPGIVTVISAFEEAHLLRNWEKKWICNAGILGRDR